MGTLQDGIEKWAARHNMPAPSARATQSKTGGAYTGGGRQHEHVRKKEIGKLDLPEDYVDKAEQVILELIGEQSQKKGQDNKITTSKIRKILSQILEIFNVERLRTDEKLLPESMKKIQLLRVRILYEAGRDKKAVLPFVEKSKLLEFLNGIGDSREKFINFTHYMEALVAYHRFYDGDD